MSVLVMLHKGCIYRTAPQRCGVETRSEDLPMVTLQVLHFRPLVVWL